MRESYVLLVWIGSIKSLQCSKSAELQFAYQYIFVACGTQCRRISACTAVQANDLRMTSASSSDAQCRRKNYCTTTGRFLCRGPC